jgi:hypothetical protein
MHAGRAAVAGEFAHGIELALLLGQARDELVDDVAQPVRLLLARDVAGDAAGILHVLVAVEHVLHRGRLVAGRIPQVHGEDQRVAARVVVEHGLRRRVG